MQINEEIRDPEVRLIDENGQQLGIMDVRAAQRLADERELDLVKVSFNTPPTCKLMDYSKYRYDMMKREKEQKKNQKTIEIKNGKAHIHHKNCIRCWCCQELCPKKAVLTHSNPIMKLF